jgi:hypothetical protein
MCLPGSPCNSVLPQFPSVPRFYFQLRVRTTPASALFEYCRLERVFVVAVSGMPMGFLHTFLSVFGTAAVLVAVTALVFGLRRRGVTPKDMRHATAGEIPPAVDGVPFISGARLEK